MLHGLPAGQVLVHVLVGGLPVHELHDQAPPSASFVEVQLHGVLQDGYPLWLQDLEYPEPDPLMLLDSTV